MNCDKFCPKDHSQTFDDASPESMNCNSECTMYSLLFDCFKKRDLHFVHLNIRSILPKIDQLREFVRCNKPAILGLTETWCDNSISESEISLPNYVCYRNDRNRDGGGVCVFVRCDIAFNTRPDLGNDYIESAWIEILLPKSKPILVGVCYWPHKQMDFTKSLKIFVQTLNVSLNLKL